MFRLIAAGLAVASCVGTALAQATPSSAGAPRTYTLPQALDAAGANSPSSAAASAGVSVAEAGRSVAGLRPNPEASLEVENFAGTGEYTGLRSAEITASIGVPIELGGKRSARLGVAQARLDRAQIDVAIAAAELRSRVTQAYIAAATAERRIVISQQQADFAAISLRAATARVFAGAASPIEEQRASVQNINASLALAKARRDAEVARGTLARLTGAPVAGALDMTWFERVQRYGPVEPRSAVGTLAEAAALADLRTATAQVRLARSNRMPDLTVSAGARRLSATSDIAAVVGVSVPLPLFNSGRAALNQALAEQQVADANRRVAQLEAEQAIAAAQAEVVNAAAAAEAAGGPALQAALEAARIAAIGYANGKFSQLELLEGQRTLAETRSAYVDALAAYQNATAQLERLTTPLPSGATAPGRLPGEVE